MITPSLSTLTRGILAAVALTAASTGANATTYHSDSPDPFASGSNYTVDLQNATHTAITLPGLGFSATDFIISGFSVTSATDTAAGVDWVYNANFQAFNAGVAVTGVLTSTNFEVLVNGQHGLPTGPLVGTFTEQLLHATFTGGGISTFLAPGDVPTGSVTIAGGGLLGGYNITPPNLTINAQYTDPNGNTHDTPPLTDVNGTPSSVPEIDAASGTGALALLAGALALIGERRRRVATAA